MDRSESREVVYVLYGSGSRGLLSGVFVVADGWADLGRANDR